ncbi:MAG: NUDIX domain-containing protein [Flavobacteriales bacterium]|nr:NUDIX domain-containing protein [Flavobacteriales bacterium]MBP9080670.1 NUDIX domain-containing protein [Flavobacteriales bacterium]
MKPTKFNIRVYGLLVHAGRLLVSEEVIGGDRYMKFPGGGLVPGEGTHQGLQREIREELGMEVRDLRHFYTTDFFQPSAFHPQDQIISIYYRFMVDDPGSIVDGAPAPGPEVEFEQKLHWIPLERAVETDVDLPIDRVVMRLILEQLT